VSLFYAAEFGLGSSFFLLFLPGSVFLVLSTAERFGASGSKSKPSVPSKPGSEYHVSCSGYKYSPSLAR